MGRSKSQRRNSRMDDTDDDSMSTISTGTSTGASSDATLINEVEEELDEGTILEGFIDALYEKRAKTREEGLKGLINAFKSTVLMDFVEDKHETLIDRCIGSLRKGAGTEIAFASQIIGLVALTIGAGDVAQHIVTEASPHLIRVAKLGSDSRARIAALEALALASFIGCPDHESTEEVMGVLWQMAKHKGNYHADQTLGMNKPSTEVRAVALSAWSFLLTTIPTTRIIGHYMPQCQQMLLSLLEGDEQALRLSAGEAVALLFESRNSLDVQQTSTSADSSWEPASILSRKTVEAKEEELVEQVRALAVQAGGKGQSNKKAQRSAFKGILASVEGREVSGISIKLRHGDLLAVNSWGPIIQLRFFTGVLAEGLQKHLQENALLHEVFGFVPRQEKRPTLTTKEKRLYMSPNSVLSKARTQNMNRKRSQVYAGQVGHFNAVEADNDSFY